LASLPLCWQTLHGRFSDFPQGLKNSILLLNLLPLGKMQQVFMRMVPLCLCSGLMRNKEKKNKKSIYITPATV